MMKYCFAIMWAIFQTGCCLANTVPNTLILGVLSIACALGFTIALNADKTPSKSHEPSARDQLAVQRGYQKIQQVSRHNNGGCLYRNNNGHLLAWLDPNQPPEFVRDQNGLVFHVNVEGGPRL